MSVFGVVMTLIHTLACHIVEATYSKDHKFPQTASHQFDAASIYNFAFFRREIKIHNQQTNSMTVELMKTNFFPLISQ